MILTWSEDKSAAKFLNSLKIFREQAVSEGLGRGPQFNVAFEEFLKNAGMSALFTAEDYDWLIAIMKDEVGIL